MSVKIVYAAVKQAVEAQKSISEAFDMMEEFFGVRYDNEHGEKGMKAGYGGKLKKIGNIMALVRLIEEGKRR